MWVVLTAAPAGGVAREVVHPFYDDAADALVHWLGLLPFAMLLTYVLVGRWKKGMTVLWRPTWPEARRVLVVAPLALFAVRLLIEDDASWRWLFAGIATVVVALAVARGICVVRDRRRRTDVYGNVATDPYAATSPTR